MGREGLGKELLHDVRRVRAQHERFPMGHIDYAHEPKGNGQPETHNQQYGGEADAIEYIGDRMSHAQERFDALHGLIDRRENLRILLL
jgi:hypothetical protein